MLFADIIGQHTVKQQLTDMVANNRLSHAILMLGPDGVGGLPLAIAFAQYLVSLPLNNGQGDGTVYLHPDEARSLKPFERASQLLHPDLHFSYPVVTKKNSDSRPPKSTDYIAEWREFVKHNPYNNLYEWLQFIGAENKQGNITAEECNDIIHKLSLKAYESMYKVLVMWMPEFLGKEGNKLLKLIEEPPPNTIFILVAEQEEMILPTLISRCRVVKLHPLSNEEIKDGLVAQKGIKPEDAWHISLMVEGNVREAFNQIDQKGDDWIELLKKWLNSTFIGDPLTQVKLSEEISRYSREKQKQFLRYFGQLTAYAIRIGTRGGDSVHAMDKEKEFAVRLNKVCNFNQQKAIIELLDKSSYQIERNANGKMLFLSLSITIHYIIKNNVILSVI